jgi:hypothetical protein
MDECKQMLQSLLDEQKRTSQLLESLLTFLGQSIPPKVV